MTSSSLSSTCDCGSVALERVRYYPRQLIDATTLTTDQEYERNRARQHNRLLHGWGVVCGLEVKANPQEKQPWRITVCPGYALAPQGDSINIPAATDFDLATGTQPASDPCANALPCPPLANTAGKGDERFVYLAARYTECYSRPERVLPGGCGCDESACEYARIRDGFELKLLFALPQSHTKAAAADAAWCEEIRGWARSKERGPAPVPACPECFDDPWVVLARIRLPETAQSAIDQSRISYEGRRVQYSVTALRILIECA